MVSTQHKFIGVFDGMGGVKGGEQAAIICRDTIGRQLLQLQSNPTAEQVKEAYRSGWQLAKLRFRQEATNNLSLKDMGSTAVVGKHITEHGKEKIVYAQSGDSRLYVFRKNGELMQLTQYECVVLQSILTLFDNTSDPDIINRYPSEWNSRHMVKNYISANLAEPTIREYEITEDDVLFLATSDGVNENINHQAMAHAIQRLVGEKKSPREIVDTLTTMASTAEDGQSFRAKKDDKTAAVMVLAD